MTMLYVPIIKKKKKYKYFNVQILKKTLIIKHY